MSFYGSKSSSVMSGVSPKLQLLDQQVDNKIEWKYELRREAQEILPGVYVGPFQPSWKLSTLEGLGITHILCIAESREQHLFSARFPDRFQYLILEIRDADDQNLIRIFPQTQDFIDSAIAMGGRVLVHCGDGISRSPAVVTAYVMCKASLTHEDAFAFVQSRRFCVAPRIEFQHQIEAYGSIFAARQTMSMDSGAQSGQRARRRVREEDDDEDDNMESAGTMDQDMVQRIPNNSQWSANDMPIG